MSPIESTTGGVTTSGAGSLKINAFTRPTAKGREQPLFLAEKDAHSGVKPLGAPDVIQSGAKRTGLVWSKKRHMVDNGVFIKFCFTRTKPMGSGGFGAEQSNMMIRAREGGPLTRIAIDLPQDAHSRMSVAYIEGRFDILTKEQIKELGIDKNAQGASELQSYDDEIDFVHVEILEKQLEVAESIKPTVVKTKAGAASDKVLLRRKKVRRIGA